MCMCVIARSSVSVKTEDFVGKESGVGGRLSTRRICSGLWVCWKRRQSDFVDGVDRVLHDCDVFLDFV